MERRQAGKLTTERAENTEKKLWGVMERRQALVMPAGEEGSMGQAISGQKKVTAAGTAVALGTLQVNGPVMVKALDTNTGVVAVGNDGAGDVTVENGLRLAAGEVVVFEWVGSLASLKVDAAVSGEGVAWLLLRV